MKEFPAARFHERGKHQIGPGLEIQRRHNQLAEPRLAEILNQELCIPAAELGRWRLFRGGRSSKYLPEQFSNMAQPGFCRPRRSNDPGPPTSSIAMSHGCAQLFP